MFLKTLQARNRLWNNKILVHICPAWFYTLIRVLWVVSIRMRFLFLFFSFPNLLSKKKHKFVLVWDAGALVRCLVAVNVVYISPLHQLEENWYQCSSGFKESLIKFLDSWSQIPAQGHWDPDWSFPVDLAFLGWPCPRPPLYCTLLSIPANDHDERPFISLLQPPQWNKSTPPPPQI